jgi:hypothetical protein
MFTDKGLHFPWFQMDAALQRTPASLPDITPEAAVQFLRLWQYADRNRREAARQAYLATNMP